MAKFMLDNLTIDYQIKGADKSNPPLIVLNGIMMSQASWIPFQDELTKKRQVIFLDFIDQGKSDSGEGLNYSHSLQIKMVVGLMKHLPYDIYDIFGISYGGEIALQIAIKNQELVRKLAVYNVTYKTTPVLSHIGKSWIKAAETYDPETFFYTTMPWIYSKHFYNKEIEWFNKRLLTLKELLNKKFLDGMIRLINSSENYNIFDELFRIKAETQIVGSDKDLLTPGKQGKIIAEKISMATYKEFVNCGHASMYEQPNVFLESLLGFLDRESSVQII
jgi:pimeloyl-ACP methyl ester carboxylesterase